jgi:hypothetical protein
MKRFLKRQASGRDKAAEGKAVDVPGSQIARKKNPRIESDLKIKPLGLDVLYQPPGVVDAIVE